MRTHIHGTVAGEGRRTLSVLASVLAVLWIALPSFAGDGSPPAGVTVLENTPDHIVIQYQIDDYAATPVKIDGREYVQISLGTESLIKNRGAPAVPSINRSIVIPGDTEMAVNVLAS
ncbi:MAG: C25 family peptidase propeptide domain-containing protein, partial [Planctomycetota bacterium]